MHSTRRTTTTRPNWVRFNDRTGIRFGWWFRTTIFPTQSHCEILNKSLGLISSIKRIQSCHWTNVVRVYRRGMAARFFSSQRRSCCRSAAAAHLHQQKKSTRGKTLELCLNKLLQRDHLNEWRSLPRLFIPINSARGWLGSNKLWNLFYSCRD